MKMDRPCLKTHAQEHMTSATKTDAIDVSVLRETASELFGDNHPAENFETEQSDVVVFEVICERQCADIVSENDTTQ